MKDTTLIVLLLNLTLLVTVNGGYGDVDEDVRYIKNWSYLTKIPKDIPEDTTYVEVTSNDIRSLKSGDFAQLSRCKQMILDDNSIASIEPGSFRGLTSLTNLSICSSWIRKIKSNMWSGLENLEEITLCTNLFGRETKIQPGAFSTLPHLEMLRLGHLSLKSLKSDMWTGLDKLKELSIFSNYISITEPGTFKQLLNLERLSLRDNRIYKLNDGTFDGLSDLLELDLYYNELGADWDDLSRIRPGMWNGLSSLQKLSLGKNWIEILDSGSFSNLPELSDLDLSENKMVTLTPHLFGPGHPVQLHLDVSGTKLKCDADLCWLKQGVSDGWLELQKTNAICEEFLWEDVPNNCI